MLEPLTSHPCDPYNCARYAFDGCGGVGGATCRDCPAIAETKASRFEANAASRKEMARGSTLALYLILAVSVALFAWSASVGLGRTENSYQEDARV